MTDNLLCGIAEIEGRIQQGLASVSVEFIRGKVVVLPPAQAWQLSTCQWSTLWLFRLRKVGKVNPVSSKVSEQQLYEQLQYYTLGRGGVEFVHQYIVDAWAAQHADGNTKPITLVFALVGLYLHVEKGYSGRQVQQVHMELAQHKSMWPYLLLPEERGLVTVKQVMAASAGPQRDQAIDTWCMSVWSAFSDSHQLVIELLQQHGIIR